VVESVVGMVEELNEELLLGLTEVVVAASVVLPVVDSKIAGMVEELNVVVVESRPVVVDDSLWVLFSVLHFGTCS